MSEEGDAADDAAEDANPEVAAGADETSHLDFASQKGGSDDAGSDDVSADDQSDSDPIEPNDPDEPATAGPVGSPSDEVIESNDPDAPAVAVEGSPSDVVLSSTEDEDNVTGDDSGEVMSLMMQVKRWCWRMMPSKVAPMQQLFMMLKTHRIFRPKARSTVLKVVPVMTSSQLAMMRL